VNKRNKPVRCYIKVDFINWFYNNLFCSSVPERNKKELLYLF
jgi:hypothetical protein